MSVSIKNIDDLRHEIFHLKHVEIEQRHAIGDRFKNVSSVFSTVYSLFPKSGGGAAGKSKGFFEQDIAGLLSRIVLPFTLNKTIFRNANFLVKTLVSLVSQRASRFVTEDAVVSVWDKVKSLFTKPHEDNVGEVKDVPPYVAPVKNTPKKSPVSKS
jgi:hypothetical protein